MQKNYFKDKYYKRILLVLLIICAIPVLLLGGSIINLVKRQKSELYGAQQANVNNIQNQFETIFQFIETGMIRLALKEETSAVMNVPREASHFQALNSMRNELQLILSSELSMDEILFINNRQNWVMSSTSLGEIDHSVYKKLIENLSKVPKTSFWYDDENYIYLAKRLPVNSYSDSGMLVARFNKRSLETDLLSGSDGSAAIVLDDQGEIVLGTEHGAILNYVRSDEKMNGNLEAGRLTRTSFHGASYVLVSNQSVYNKWHYILVVSEAQINQRLKQVLFMLFLVFFSLVVLEAYVVYICSKKLYTPIDEMNTMVDRGMQEEQGREIGKESDIKDKLRYIMDNNVRLRKEVSSHLMSSHQLFLRKVYQGEVDGLNEQDFIGRGIVRENFAGCNMHVLAIKYSQAFESPEDKELYMFALGNIITELLSGEEIFPVVPIGRVAYVTCFMESLSEEGVKMKLQAAAGMMIETVSRFLNRPVVVGISRSFFQISDMGNAADECRRTLQDMIGLESSYRFYNHNEEPVSALADNRIRQSRMKIIQAVTGADERQCEEALHEYFSDIQMMNYYLLKLELGKLVSDILDLYAEYAVIPDYERVGDIVDFDITKKINSIDKLMATVWESLLEPLLARICRPAENSRIIGQIVEYINDNVEKDLSLEQCARDFNYNPNYLSRMFKKHFGQNFTDYVIMKKMECCKELLLHTDISVNELTERFGYSCPQNFIRIFKKYTLMTPGQFRKQSKEK